VSVREPVHGMQRERTTLAWQRTGLSVAVAAAVLARLTYGDLGRWALLALAACLGLCGWMLLGTRRRPTAQPARQRPVGGWAAAACVSIVVLGLTELAALAVG
jgi:uncharacterized membrane protein YidH (DUF202 family)